MAGRSLPALTRAWRPPDLHRWGGGGPRPGSRPRRRVRGAQKDQRGVMGDEGSGKVGRIDGNDTRPRPQQGEGVGDGVAVGARLEGDQDRRVRHVEISQYEAQGRRHGASLRP